LLINLKVHSAYNKFFDQKVYSFDAYVASDVIDYLKGVHPKFAKYMVEVNSDEANESFSLLDKDLKQITADMLLIKHFKDGETVHLVPTISGAGGKASKMFAVFAIVAFGMATGGAGFAALGGVGGGVGASASAAGGGGFLGTMLGGGGGAMGWLGRIGLNIGMSIIGRMFQKSPAAKQQQKTTESSVRDNGMFGSLTNSSSSGTPIALIYGEHRVSGQFLSGYISSISHGSGDPISVGGQFDGE
jgi:predicted phage tail protein